MDLHSLKEELEAYGQSHLLQFWDALTDDQKQKLYKDLKSIDFAEVTKIFAQSAHPQENDGVAIDQDLLEPLPEDVHESVTRSSEEVLRDYRQEGKDTFLIFGNIIIRECVGKPRKLWPNLKAMM